MSSKTEEGAEAQRRAKLDIRLLHEVVWVLASDETDGLVYGRTLGTIAGLFNATDGELAFRNEKDKLCAIKLGASELRAVAEDEEGDLARAASDCRAGSESRGSFTANVESLGESVAYLTLERENPPFARSDYEGAVEMLEELAPSIGQRVARSRQEIIRRKAEQELRRSEERLRSFFEESPDMIYTSNSEDRIASINSAGLRLLGLNDRFSAVGRHFSEFTVSPEDRRLFLDRIGTEGVVSNYEILLKRADGSTIFCIETSQAVRNREGNIYEIQGIVRDISDRIEAERELWKANMELAEANMLLKDTQMIMVQHEKMAAIGQLASGIAHEINNPLGFLRSNHSTLGRYLKAFNQAWNEAKEVCGELERIERLHNLNYILSDTESIYLESEEGFRRIMEIVQGLRSFARVDSESGFALYELDRGIQSTLVVARNEIKYVAEVELGLGAPPSFLALGSQVNQVILNILVNAAQAIAEMERPRMGKIRITTGKTAKTAYCKIEDDGPGIPEDIRLRIFDPFFTTKKPGKGTGLGLSISYDIIVNKHNGRLSVGRSPLGGAEFLLELPLERPEAFQ